MECDHNPTKHIVKWKLTDLKPHPLQSHFFNDLPFHLLRDLAEDMRQRGLKEPLEILPDGTIVCGHQRRRAAEMLGWDKIDVWVNHELAEQGELAIEQRLIEDNLARRNLDKLDQVRCYRRLVEMANDTPEQRRRSHQLGRVRDIVGSRLGMSGGTLERYLRILEAPREVQEAFRAGQVSLVNASKVTGLAKEVQQQLVDDMRAGADAKQAVAARLAGRTPDALNESVGTFIRSLQRNVDAAEAHAEQVQSIYPFDVGILKRAQALIGRLLRKAAKPPSLRPARKGSRKRAS